MSRKLALVFVRCFSFADSTHHKNNFTTSQLMLFGKNHIQMYITQNWVAFENTLPIMSKMVKYDSYVHDLVFILKPRKSYCIYFTFVLSKASWVFFGCFIFQRFLNLVKKNLSSSMKFLTWSCLPQEFSNI